MDGEGWGRGHWLRRDEVLGVEGAGPRARRGRGAGLGGGGVLLGSEGAEGAGCRLWGPCGPLWAMVRASWANGAS